MSSPRSLASLPDIVLRETLAHLLIDTPRAPHRTAVLRTCSTLHDLGLPLLYRVVDIRLTLVSHVRALFGAKGGLLTTTGRHAELSRRVVELRVGPAEPAYKNHDITLGEVNLPRCGRLVLTHNDDAGCSFPDALRSILLKLPVVQFVLEHGPGDYYDTGIRASGYRSIASRLGMSDQTWEGLDQVTYSGKMLWDTGLPSRAGFGLRLPLRDWSFKTLVFDLVQWDSRIAQALIHPLDGNTQPFFDRVTEIKLRVNAQVEGHFRSKVEKTDGQKRRNLARERILPLIVFIGPEGQARKLIE